MFPFTEEGLNKDIVNDNYKYELRGVVNHVETIDQGHYYSFIKDKSQNKWFKYNNELVSSLSEDLISEECFGGKNNNAYLLFYERVGFENCTVASKSDNNDNLQIVEESVGFASSNFK
jgi:ubiquitin C-terminal hydrolase